VEKGNRLENALWEKSSEIGTESGGIRSWFLEGFLIVRTPSLWEEIAKGSREGHPAEKGVRDHTNRGKNKSGKDKQFIRLGGTDLQLLTVGGIAWISLHQQRRAKSGPRERAKGFLWGYKKRKWERNGWGRKPCESQEGPGEKYPVSNQVVGGAKRLIKGRTKNRA